MIKKIVEWLKVSTLIIAATLLLLEVSLRVVPSVIPTPILIRFNDSLRLEIASQQGFMTEDLTYVFERDDNGPELRIPNPNTTVTYPEIFAFDSDVGVEMTATMDEIGFCNPKGKFTDTASFDVVAIGDSLTWCHTVNIGDTFSYQLAEKSGASVFNLGKGGIGLYEYVQILKGFGLEKKPKLVFLNVYEGNDLRDAIEYWQAVNQRGKLAQEEDTAAMRWRDSIRNSFVGKRSYVVNLLIASMSYAYSYIAYSEERAANSIDFGYTVSIGSNDIEFNSKNLDVDEVVFARQLFDNRIDLELFTQALESYVELSRTYGFIPVVSYIPSAHTAYAKTATFDDDSIAVLLSRFSLEMRQFFRDKGIDLGYKFVDLTPAMQDAATMRSGDELLYFPTNLHLTRHGHYVISERLYNELPEGLR